MKELHKGVVHKQNDIDWSIRKVSDKKERMKIIKTKAQYIEDRAMNKEKSLK